MRNDNIISLSTSLLLLLFIFVYFDTRKLFETILEDNGQEFEDQNFRKNYSGCDFRL